jgi:SPP1 family phage portal protein
MGEDVRNTVLVLENYDGENLGEFRKNLMAYGAVKVRSESGANGDVRALRIEVDSTNYSTILALLKQSLFQNCRAFDTANIRLDGSPNSLQMRGVYQAMDMDANMTIVKYKWALEKLFWFVKSHLKETGKGNYLDEKIKVVFNKDMLVNEQEIMTSLTNAGVRIPNILMLEQIPWINDPKKAQELIEEEDRKMMDTLDPYKTIGSGGKGTSSNRPKVNTNSNQTRLTGGNTK